MSNNTNSANRAKALFALKELVKSKLPIVWIIMIWLVIAAQLYKSYQDDVIHNYMQANINQLDYRLKQLEPAGWGTTSTYKYTYPQYSTGYTFTAKVMHPELTFWDWYTFTLQNWPSSLTYLIIGVLSIVILKKNPNANL